MNTHEFSVGTRSRTELVDITAQVARIVQESKASSGLAVVFVPHTTAAITINENADPSVQHDILGDLNRLVPLSGPYQHTEGNSGRPHQILPRRLFRNSPNRERAFGPGHLAGGLFLRVRRPADEKSLGEIIPG